MSWRRLPPPPGAGDPRPVSESLGRLAADLGVPDPHLLNQVFCHWEAIVGAELARHARPLALHGKVLVVGVDQPAWAAQLGYLKGELVARVAEATGSSELSEVRIRVTGR